MFASRPRSAPALIGHSIRTAPNSASLFGLTENDAASGALNLLLSARGRSENMRESRSDLFGKTGLSD